MVHSDLVLYSSISEGPVQVTELSGRQAPSILTREEAVLTGMGSSTPREALSLRSSRG